MFLAFLVTNDKNQSILLVIFCLLAVTFCADQPTVCTKETIHVIIPTKFIKKICLQNTTCVPLVCQLHATSSFSNIPSDNSVFFTDNLCKVRKPPRWDEWIKYHFDEDSHSDEFYFQDFDNDGLVNLVEYYANVSYYNSSSSQSSNGSVNAIGTNPLNADTDNDKLLDGYEYNFRMNPTVYDRPEADYDGDGISNEMEQKYGTNPLQADSDGDGVGDKYEIENFANPNDISDRGQAEISLQHAYVRLAVGDDSGSGSEKYKMTVGEYTLSSVYYHVVNKIFLFKPGTYKITVDHVKSKLHVPDHDLKTSVTQIGGLASMKIIDNYNLLGRYRDFDIHNLTRKVAWLVIERNCKVKSIQGEKVCSCIENCNDCRSESHCAWDNTEKCKKKRAWEYATNVLKPSSCGCNKCSVWYKSERQNTTWLNDLNQNFKCPCKVKSIPFLTKLTKLQELDNPSNKQWIPDSTCRDKGLPSCQTFKPGANGCLVSGEASSYGARQQCCYDGNGNLIHAGQPGAGTPQKSFDYFAHQSNDVETYNSCCKNCYASQQCQHYRNEVRKGDTSHCV